MRRAIDTRDKTQERFKIYDLNQHSNPKKKISPNRVQTEIKILPVIFGRTILNYEQN